MFSPVKLLLLSDFVIIMWEQVKPWKYCKCNLQIAKLKLPGFHVTWTIENPDNLSLGLENPVVSCMANIIVSFICIFVFTSETKGITFEGLLITTEKYWVCVTVFMSLYYMFSSACFSSTIYTHLHNILIIQPNSLLICSLCIFSVPVVTQENKNKNIAIMAFLTTGPES